MSGLESLGFSLWDQWKGDLVCAPALASVSLKFPAIAVKPRLMQRNGSSANPRVLLYGVGDGVESTQVFSVCSSTPCHTLMSPGLFLSLAMPRDCVTIAHSFSLACILSCASLSVMTHSLLGKMALPGQRTGILSMVLPTT